MSSIISRFECLKSYAIYLQYLGNLNTIDDIIETLINNYNHSGKMISFNTLYNLSLYQKLSSYNIFTIKFLKKDYDTLLDYMELLKDSFYDLLINVQQLKNKYGYNIDVINAYHQLYIYHLWYLYGSRINKHIAPKIILNLSKEKMISSYVALCDETNNKVKLNLYCGDLINYCIQQSEENIMIQVFTDPFKYFNGFIDGNCITINENIALCTDLLRYINNQSHYPLIYNNIGKIFTQQAYIIRNSSDNYKLIDYNKPIFFTFMPDIIYYTSLNYDEVIKIIINSYKTILSTAEEYNIEHVILTLLEIDKFKEIKQDIINSIKQVIIEFMNSSVIKQITFCINENNKIDVEQIINFI